MALTQHQIIYNVKTALLSKAALFEEEWQLHGKPEQYPTQINGKQGIIFYWPSKTSPDTADGYRLKHSTGYIALSETYIFQGATNNRLIKRAHVYRFVTDTVSYTCEDTTNSHPEKVLPYSFHYDQDLDYNQEDFNSLRHPNNHLQVLHTHPRFNADDNLTVGEFLEKVQVTCYKNSQFEPYTEPMYLISRP